MPGPDLPDRAAALLSLTAATEERALSQLTELAASEVAGCVAASVTVWRHGEPSGQAASHPDAARLTGVQLACARGPILEAAAAAGTVNCPDTLSEDRWPEFAAAALALGIRSCVVLSSRGEPVVTLALWGARPFAFDPGELQLAELLVAYGSALVGAMADYDNSRRLTGQLLDAARSRTVVDQAKGILMHALGCTAEEALQRMQQISQRTSVRAVEVAQRVIDAHSPPPGTRAGASSRRAQPRGR